MKLYFARHGQTDSNANKVNTPSYDEPLNQAGIVQAERLADELKDVAFDAIISSPLRRALQTAEIINRYHGLGILQDAAWRERDMDSYVDLGLWNDLFDFDAQVEIKNAESLTNFFQRGYSAIDTLKDGHHNATVLVVSHGGMQHVVYAYANKLPWSGNIRISPMKNCEYRIYDL